MDNIYRQNILDHYKNPRNFGRIPNPDTSSEEGNPLCGDKIGVDIKITSKNNPSKIADIRFHGVGCAVSVASASMLTENIKGKSIKTVLSMDKDVVLALLGIQLGPTRLKCALLALETIHQALNKYQPKLHHRNPTK